MSDDPHDQLLLQIRGAVAEYERNLIADRMRRGRRTKYRNGTLLPWTMAPYGYILDAERPRDPSRVQVDPGKAEIVKQMFTWHTEPALLPEASQQRSLYWITKQLSEDQIPTPTGEGRWNVATVRGILRNPASSGNASRGPGTFQ